MMGSMTAHARTITSVPGEAGRSDRDYRAVLALSRPVVAALLRVHVEGELPAQGPLIVAPNHISHLDPVALGVTLDALGRRPWFLVTPAVVELPVLGAVMRRGGCIAAPRGSGTQALSQASAVLADGGLVVVYPEGHVAAPGVRMRAKAGLGLLARLTGAEVVPVGQWGMERGTTRLAWARRRRAAMVLGRPLAPPARGRDREFSEEVLTGVRALVPRARELAGQPPDPQN